MAGPHVLNKLKALQVEKAKLPGTYSDGGGLNLVITDRLTKRWELRLAVGGRRRQLGLGTYPTVTLEEARRRAAGLKQDRAEDRPITTARDRAQARIRAVEKAAADAVTFKQAFAMFWPLRRQQLTNGQHIWQWEQTMEAHAFPVFGHKPVSELKSGDILDAVAPLWHSKPETARRTLQRIEAVIKFAIVKGLREKASPCFGVAEVLGRHRRDPDQPKHFASLPWQEVPEFLRALRQRDFRTSLPLAFEFLVLTACRSGEVRRAQWKEFDLEQRKWTIPASRTKSRREHVVPLSDRCLEILATAKTAYTGELVFPNQAGRLISDMAFTQALRKMGYGERATAHGFRSSFKNWAAEHGVRDEVSEAALAHVVPEKVRAAYLRTTFLEERRVILGKWAEQCG